MNPKRLMTVGVLVLLIAMSIIPVASALTITRTQYELVPGEMANMETYAAVVGSDDILYVAGINTIDNELAVYTWGGQGTLSVEAGTYEMEDYVYTPTDIVEFDGLFYISTVNYTNIGIPEWETLLFVFDPETGDIDVAATFAHAMLVQMTVFADELVVGADQNYVYVSDDGEDFTGYQLNENPYYFYEGAWYADDIYVLGVATAQDNLFIETRNCSSMIGAPEYIKNPNQPMSAPNQRMDVALDDTIAIYDTDDVTDGFGVNTTDLTLSRTLNLRAGYYTNYTNPLYAMPNGEEVAIVSNSAVYGFDPDYTFRRYYNGDSLSFNPTPVFGSPYQGVNYESSIYINTINSANNAPSCPVSLFEPPRQFAEKPVLKEQKVMQSIDATSAITSTRVNYLVDTVTGETTEIFSHSPFSMWDGGTYDKGSYYVVTSSGVFTYHQVALDLSGAINSLFLALLIIGIIFLAFGAASWNRGFEDVLSLSLGGALVTTGILLYLFPTLYLTWLLILVPIVTLFILMYVFIKSYKLEKLDFRLQKKDALILLTIFFGVAIVIYFAGDMIGIPSPFWLPA